MKITYTGRHTGGIFLPGDVFVGHGETVNVADDLAAELVARGDFTAAKKSTPTTSATPEES